MIDLGDTASEIRFGKNILVYSPKSEEGSNGGPKEARGNELGVSLGMA